MKNFKNNKKYFFNRSKNKIQKFIKNFESKKIEILKSYKSLENFLINENYQIYNLDGKITNMDEIKKLLDSLDEKHQTIGNFYLVNKSSDMLKYI